EREGRRVERPASGEGPPFLPAVRFGADQDRNGRYFQLRQRDDRIYLRREDERVSRQVRPHDEEQDGSPRRIPRPALQVGGAGEKIAWPIITSWSTGKSDSPRSPFSSKTCPRTSCARRSSPISSSARSPRPPVT